MNIETKHLWSHKCPKKWDQYTLIALVITIVILIILAGVAISISLENNGLFNKAKQAKQEYLNAQGYEEEQIAKVSNEINNYVNASRNQKNITASSVKRDNYVGPHPDTNDVSLTLNKGKYIVFLVDVGGYPESTTVSSTKTDNYLTQSLTYTKGNTNVSVLNGIDEVECATESMSGAYCVIGSSSQVYYVEINEENDVITYSFGSGGNLNYFATTVTMYSVKID